MLKLSDLTPDLQKRLTGEVHRPPANPQASLSKTAEETFALQCRAQKLPMFRREYKFAEDIGRGWRFDFAWIDDGRGRSLLAAVEVEGLSMRRVNGELVVGGRHVSPTGFRHDNLKYARAAIMGWAVLRFEQGQVKDGTAIDHTVELLRARGWRP